MRRVRFYPFFTGKEAKDLLEEVRKFNKNIVGCLINYIEGYVEFDFEKEPSDAEIEELKGKFGFKYHEKIEEGR